MRLILSCAVVVFSIPAFAQKYEFGIHGGGSFYQSKEISNPRGSADAGFSKGWTVGVTMGQNMYDHVGGELRYGYIKNNMKLTSGGTEAGFGAESHVIHYDLLLHAADRESSVRPYVAVGAGAKIYRGTGSEQAFQPLSNIAILTKTTDIKGLISFGGGVKARISNTMMFRVDVHDYLTPFPKKVITPASGSSVSGWVNNIVATAGITFTF